ncbi:hypothetical protein H4W33_008155 [Kibdelosporangium phytohabitans]|nr:hypothetical protein [Kibdelosporangium phytohabitans]
MLEHSQRGTDEFDRLDLPPLISPASTTPV